MKFLELGARCLGQEEAAKVDDYIARFAPEDASVAVRRAWRSIERKDWLGVQAQARLVRTRAPRSSDGYTLEAHALIGLHRPVEAVTLLRTGYERVDDHEPVLIMLARAQAASEDADGMRKTIEVLRANAAGDGKKLATVLQLLCDQELMLGNSQRALAAVREAYRLTGDSRFLAESARLAASVGQLEHALSAWRELCTRDPTGPHQYCQAEADVKRRLDGQ